MSYIRYIFFSIMCGAVTTGMEAQSFKTLKDSDEKTKKYFEEGRKAAMAQAFGTAKARYRKALDVTPDLQDALLELAGIYFSQKNEDSCIYYLNEIKKINPQPTARVYYTLATIYYNKGDYEKALPELDKYLASDIKNAKSAEDAVLKRNNCLFAIEAKKRPRMFEPRALSDSINTTAPEYLPSISADGELLVFSKMTNRQEDLFVSQKTGDEWGKALPLDGVNTEKYNEAGHCISADGKTIVFTGCNMPGGLGSCDLYVSYFRKNRWTKPENLGAPVNTKGWESQPSLSADGRMLYFSSERPGGFGLKDIWVSERNDLGKWSTPENIGAPVNTPRNEGSPFIHPDNQTLYFMSDGLPGMGGTDLYISHRTEDGSWSEPVNLGYPINTLGNEGALVVNTTGDRAFYTSVKPGSVRDKDGMEDTDIFWFELDPELRPKPVSFFKAFVLDKDSKKPVESGVKVTDISSNALYYQGNTADDGSTLVCLPRGDRYGIQIIAPGYIFISEAVMLPDSEDVDRPHIATYFLQKIGEAVGQPFVLKNIFFESGSAQLSEVSNAELEVLVDLMKANPTLKVQINGHTDNVGSEQDNLLLSQQRAEAVTNALKKSGIPSASLIAKGYGETRPVSGNDSEEGRRQNRRIEFVLLANNSR